MLAACSCCAIDQVCYSCTYQRVRCKDNLGICSRTTRHAPRSSLSNIREQCAWAHADDPLAATAKATALTAAAVAKARAASVRPVVGQQVERSALVLGDGVAARTCRGALNGQGIAARQLGADVESVQRAGGRYVVQQYGERWQASALILAPGTAREAESILAAFGENGHRPQARPAWSGLDTHRPGVFYCQPDADPATAGAAAAARAAAWLGRADGRAESIAAVVDPARCRACSTCVTICEFGAPQLVGEEPQRASWIDPAICTGCGTCAAHCPSGAIVAGYSTDVQLEAMLDAVLA